MDKLKLTIELLPQGAWGNDLSIILSKKRLEYIKRVCFKKSKWKMRNMWL